MQNDQNFEAENQEHGSEATGPYNSAKYIFGFGFLLRFWKTEGLNIS